MCSNRGCMQANCMFASSIPLAAPLRKKRCNMCATKIQKRHPFLHTHTHTNDALCGVCKIFGVIWSQGFIFDADICVGNPLLAYAMAICHARKNYRLWNCANF